MPEIESEEMNLSINKLCISKLLQRIESRFTPIQQGRRRAGETAGRGKGGCCVRDHCLPEQRRCLRHS